LAGLHLPGDLLWHGGCWLLVVQVGGEMKGRTIKTLKGLMGMGDSVPCTIRIGGQDFTCLGSFVAKHKDTGKLMFTAYGDWDGIRNHIGYVTNWHGTKKVRAFYGDTWRSNMGDKRCQVRVYINNGGKKIRFTGIWYGIDNNQVINLYQR
jgi:hypothetical protein